MAESGADVCEICGYTTNSHLVHTAEGHIYCSKHFLLHVLNDEIEEEKIKLEEEKVRLEEEKIKLEEEKLKLEEEKLRVEREKKHHK